MIPQAARFRLRPTLRLKQFERLELFQSFKAFNPFNSVRAGVESSDGWETLSLRAAGDIGHDGRGSPWPSMTL